MTDAQEFDVIIVGGGLVGASLAIALSQPHRDANTPSLRVAVIEAHPLPAVASTQSYQPSFDARSTAISWGARLIYERLGLWADVSERATPIRYIHVSDKGRFGATRMAAEDVHCDALGYVVENQWLGVCLLKHLETCVGVQMICPGQVQSVRHTGGDAQVTVLLEEQREVTCRAKLVVLADGGRSGLREQLGMDVAVHDYGQAALIANLATERPHEDWAYERFTDQGPIALLPLMDSSSDEHRCALVWTLPSEEAEQLVAASQETFLASLQDRFGFRLGRFLRVGERYCYPLKLEVCREQVRPAMVVVGNAAHTLHPVAGQGYNLALRGVLALADIIRAAHARRVLEGESAPDLGELSVLARFEHWHESDQFKTTLLSDQLIRVFANNDPVLTIARDLGLVGLDVLPPAKQLFARQAMGLG